MRHVDFENFIWSFHKAKVSLSYFLSLKSFENSRVFPRGYEKQNQP